MKISLRAPEPNDVDMMYRLENTVDVAKSSSNIAPVSRQMLWDYVQNYSANPFVDHQLRFIIEADSVPAGTIDITDIDNKNQHAAIGIAVEEEYRRKGIAFAAILQAIEFCKAELGLHQLMAIVSRENVPSMNLFQKAGFKNSGCLRSWIRRGSSFEDAILLQLLFPR